MKTKKLTLCAVLSALAIVFGYIETLIGTPVMIPGVKWGLGNIVVLLALYKIDKRSAFLIMLIKVITSSALFGSPSVFIYSLSGGIISFFVMTLLKKSDFHIVSVSIGGGVSHNMGQLVCASIMMRTATVFSYLPVLIAFGAVSAVVTGILAKIILKRLSFR